MSDFDIDKLKKNWQEQDSVSRYKQEDILSMFNAKSTNYIKYIWWISLAEFSFLIFLQINFFLDDEIIGSIFYIFNHIGIKITDNVKYLLDVSLFFMKILGFCISIIFIILFYSNYKKIKVEESLKQLILRIKRIRKTVNVFIILNYILFTVNVVLFTCLTWYIVCQQNVEVPGVLFKAYVEGVILGKIVVITILYLYYRFIYGTIMRKLNKNLYQLKEMEKSEL